MTMDTSGSIVPLWSDTDTVRFVIDATKLGLLNAMS